MVAQSICHKTCGHVQITQKMSFLMYYFLHLKSSFLLTVVIIIMFMRRFNKLYCFVLFLQIGFYKGFVGVWQNLTKGTSPADNRLVQSFEHYSFQFNNFIKPGCFLIHTDKCLSLLYDVMIKMTEITHSCYLMM